MILPRMLHAVSFFCSSVFPVCRCSSRHSVRDSPHWLTFPPLIGWISVVHRAKDCGLETVKCKWRSLFTGNKRSLLLPRPSRNYSWNTIRLNTHTHTHSWLTPVPWQRESVWLAEAAFVTYISACLLVIFQLFSWASLASSVASSLCVCRSNT